MREILFKAKRTDNGEWVEGNYITDELDEEKAYIGYIFGIEDFDIVEVNPETLCQYTGLKDKNGNRIWENDVLHTPYRSKDDCIVVWYDGKFCFKTIHGQYNQDPMTLLSLCCVQKNVERLKVIGNIFDNPELLGQDGE